MNSAFAATLFGPEDLRYVAHDPGPLAKGAMSAPVLTPVTTSKAGRVPAFDQPASAPTP